MEVNYSNVPARIGEYRFQGCICSLDNLLFTRNFTFLRPIVPTLKLIDSPILLKKYLCKTRHDTYNKIAVCTYVIENKTCVKLSMIPTLNCMIYLYYLRSTSVSFREGSSILDETEVIKRTAVTATGARGSGRSDAHS